MASFLPEGTLLQTDYNRQTLGSEQLLRRAYEEGRILESVALMCDPAHNVIVDIPGAEAVIPRTEGALGIAEGVTRDIALLARVNKPVCFIITDISRSPEGRLRYTLSRAAAQKRCSEQYVSRLTAGDVIPARVTHLENFGAFVDIGCGIPSLIPIDCISVSRISHPSDRFYNGQYIHAAVKSVEGSRICLTHRELLGTWEQNCARFEVGATVTGIVRSIESYGVFIELAPNLAGLAEPHEGLAVGQTVTVGIKAIKPEKMKLKLVIIDTDHTRRPPKSIIYYINKGHINHWRYSPADSAKLIESTFDR